jgi:hypothetical protein
MFGIPEDLDLTFLHGRELVQVCLELYQVQFHFHPEGTVAVEGEWELLDVDGALLDRSKPPPRTEPFQLHLLLGQRVAESQIGPRWIALRFVNGELLRVFDNSTKYESFSIQPGDIVV